MKFKIGDIIKGRPDAKRYKYTNQHEIMKVVCLMSIDLIRVQILSNNNLFTVDPHYFELCEDKYTPLVKRMLDA